MQVSVLMPVHNARATLPIALESVRRQRGVEFECVMVDDGSTDGSSVCLEEMARADPRFRVHRLEHHGIVGALNRGLELCRGQFIARMDADDVMVSARLSRQVQLLEQQPGLAGVGCHVRSFPRGCLSEGRRRYERWINSLVSADDVERDLLVECPLAHPSLMLRRCAFMNLPYRDVDWAEDYDLLLRSQRAGLRLGVVPERLLCWRDSSGRLSRRSARYSPEQFVRAKADHLAQTHLAASPSYILWGYGPTGRALCRALAAHGKRPVAIVEVHPRRLGAIIAGARVISPSALVEARKGTGAALPVVVSVAHTGPRNEVRAALQGLGQRELADYVCAA